MEIIGIIVMVAIVTINAVSFFGSNSARSRLYDRTASDTKFNRIERSI